MPYQFLFTFWFYCRIFLLCVGWCWSITQKWCELVTDRVHWFGSFVVRLSGMWLLTCCVAVLPLTVAMFLTGLLLYRLAFSDNWTKNYSTYTIVIWILILCCMVRKRTTKSQHFFYCVRASWLSDGSVNILMWSWWGRQNCESLWRSLPSFVHAHAWGVRYRVDVLLWWVLDFKEFRRQMKSIIIVTVNNLLHLCWLDQLLVDLSLELDRSPA